MEELLIAYLVATLNMTTEQVAELLYQKSDDPDKKVLNENVLDLIKAKDVDRVKSIEANAVKGDKGKELFDNGVKKATKETLDKIEAHIKTKYGIDSDKTGVELLDFAVSKVKADTSKDSLSDDKVKVHPIYLEMEKSKNAELKSIQDAKQTEVDNLVKEYKKKEFMVTVRKKAELHFDSLNPIITGTPEVISNQKKLFIDALLAGHDFTGEGEDIIPMREEKRLEDDHKNPLSFETFVKVNAAKTYEFQKQDPKGSGGNKGGGSGGSGAGDNIVIENDEQYNKLMNEAKTPEERAKIYKIRNAKP